MILLCMVLFTYAFGGIPVGYLLAKSVKGIDIRHFGSKNIGATNVGRVLGWRYGFLALVLDALKGAIPVLFVPFWESPFSLTSTQILIGSIAILGHTFTPYLRFKGGKGVATALGVYLTLVPLVTISAVLIFILVYKISGFVSLGSILASLSMPLWYWLGSYFVAEYNYSPLVLSVLVATFFLIAFLHRENIKRLALGQELKATQNAN